MRWGRRRTARDKALLARWWRRGVRMDELADRFGVSETDLRAMAHRLHVKRRKVSRWRQLLLRVEAEAPVRNLDRLRRSLALAYRHTGDPRMAVEDAIALVRRGVGA